MQNVVLIVHVKYAFAALTANAEQVNKSGRRKPPFLCLRSDVYGNYLIVGSLLFVHCSFSPFPHFHIITFFFGSAFEVLAFVYI